MIQFSLYLFQKFSKAFCKGAALPWWHNDLEHLHMGKASLRSDLYLCTELWRPPKNMAKIGRLGRSHPPLYLADHSLFCKVAMRQQRFAKWMKLRPPVSKSSRLPFVPGYSPVITGRTEPTWGSLTLKCFWISVLLQGQGLAGVLSPCESWD